MLFCIYSRSLKITVFSDVAKRILLKRTEVRSLLLKGTVDKWLHVLLRHFDSELHTDYEEEKLGEPRQRYEAQLQACVSSFGDEIGEHGTDKADCPQRTCVDEG